jgi:hypothetical protein
MLKNFCVSTCIVDFSLNNYFLYFIYLYEYQNKKHLKINKIFKHDKNLTNNNLSCMYN